MSPVALQRGVPGVERDGVVVVHVAGIVVVDVKAAVRAPVVELEIKGCEDFTIMEKAFPYDDCASFPILCLLKCESTRRFQPTRRRL